MHFSVRPFLAIALSTLTIHSFAQDSFRSEASISTSLNDDQNGRESDVIGGNFRWYANSISTNLGPWAELAFLSQTSFYDLGYSYSESHYTYNSDHRYVDSNLTLNWLSSQKNNSVGVSGRQFLSDAIFVNFGYDHKDYETSRVNGSRSNDNTSFYRAGVGTYLTDTSTIAFNILDGDNTKPSYSLFYKNIFLAPNDGVSHGLTASMSYANQSSDVWSAGLGYDLYPSRDWAFNINASVQHSEGFSSEINETIAFGIGGQYFFNPLQSIRLRTHFSLNSPDEFFDASEVVSLSYQHRF